MRKKSWKTFIFLSCWACALSILQSPSLTKAGETPAIIYSKQINIVARPEGSDSGKAALGDDGIVYFMGKKFGYPDNKNGLIAVNPLSGTIIYGPILNPIGQHEGASISSDGTIYTVGDWNSCGDGIVTAHRSSDGTLLWSRRSSSGVYSPHPRNVPAINESLNSVYFGSSGLFSLNMQTGTINWVKSGGEYIGGCGMAIDYYENVYYATQNSYTSTQ
jgi:hypothetical protein